jgi:hypothetical protein
MAVAGFAFGSSLPMNGMGLTLVLVPGEPSRTEGTDPAEA